MNQMGSHGKSRSPSRSRSPSPGRKRRRSRSRSPSRSRSYSPRSRSRSRSPAKRRGYRDRRRSYSRSPSPVYHRRHRRSPSWERDLSPPPLFRHRGYDRHNPPCSLLVRNISRDARPEDIRGPFERFGHVKDVYLPKDYYTGEPRGFGFVQFRDPNDAADAKYNLDRTIVGGREITVVFAEENRKKPQEMRKKQRSRSSSLGGGRSLDRRSPPRSSRLRSNSYSRSPSPRR